MGDHARRGSQQLLRTYFIAISAACPVRRSARSSQQLLRTYFIAIRPFPTRSRGHLLVATAVANLFHCDSMMLVMMIRLAYGVATAVANLFHCDQTYAPVRWRASSTSQQLLRTYFIAIRRSCRYGSVCAGRNSCCELISLRSCLPGQRRWAHVLSQQLLRT